MQSGIALIRLLLVLSKWLFSALSMLVFPEGCAAYSEDDTHAFVSDIAKNIPIVAQCLTLGMCLFVPYLMFRVYMFICSLQTFVDKLYEIVNICNELLWVYEEIKYIEALLMEEVYDPRVGTCPEKHTDCDLRILKTYLNACIDFYEILHKMQFNFSERNSNKLRLSQLQSVLPKRVRNEVTRGTPFRRRSSHKKPYKFFKK